MPSSTRIPAAETGQTPRSSAVVVAILFAIVCLTWGTTWLGIKLAVDTVPPLLAAGLRFVIAFPLLYLIARA
ncbi:MAG: EamA family transporter, partial [Proteobacteria bacterium]|nr:EamA family transporter [Pseudomonadota bacterium]